MIRTTFNVQYATPDMEFPNTLDADVAIFYLDSIWWTDDDLARTLITILENELGSEIFLVSWGVAPTEVGSVTMELV